MAGAKNTQTGNRRDNDMDARTIDVYDRGAGTFANDWHEQPAPSDLHRLVQKYFHAGRTADIGCGSGRDTAWLSANNFLAIGYDPSDGLIAEARRRYPNIEFHKSSLPDLEGTASGSFVNVLCETVIMHLPQNDVGPSVRRLMSLLVPGGTLYLSWRVTERDTRDDAGRLYLAIEPETIIENLSPAIILLDEEVTSISSGKTIHHIIARK